MRTMIDDPLQELKKHLFRREREIRDAAYERGRRSGGLNACEEIKRRIQLGEDPVESCRAVYRELWLAGVAK